VLNPTVYTPKTRCVLSTYEHTNKSRDLAVE
jgi:hypothetical protein